MLKTVRIWEIADRETHGNLSHPQRFVSL